MRGRVRVDGGRFVVGLQAIRVRSGVDLGSTLNQSRSTLSVGPKLFGRHLHSRRRRWTVITAFLPTWSGLAFLLNWELLGPNSELARCAHSGPKRNASVLWVRCVGELMVGPRLRVPAFLDIARKYSPCEDFGQSSIESDGLFGHRPQMLPLRGFRTKIGLANMASQDGFCCGTHQPPRPQNSDILGFRGALSNLESHEHAQDVRHRSFSRHYILLLCRLGEVWGSGMEGLQAVRSGESIGGGQLGVSSRGSTRVVTADLRMALQVPISTNIGATGIHHISRLAFRDDGRANP